MTLAAQAMQTAGLIGYRRGTIQITDRPGLEKAACECYAIVQNRFDAFLMPLQPRFKTILAGGCTPADRWLELEVNQTSFKATWAPCAHEREAAAASTVEREHPGCRGRLPRGGDTYFSLRGSRRGQRLDEARATLMKVEIRLRFPGR